MKEGLFIPENESPTLPGGDIPASWGFHLLQELRRIEDRLENKIDATNARIDALETKMNAKFDMVDAKFGAMEAKFGTMDVKFDNKIDKLRYEMDQKLDNLRYWSWASSLQSLSLRPPSFFCTPNISSSARSSIMIDSRHGA